MLHARSHLKCVLYSVGIASTAAVAVASEWCVNTVLQRMQMPVWLMAVGSTHTVYTVYIHAPVWAAFLRVFAAPSVSAGSICLPWTCVGKQCSSVGWQLLALDCTVLHDSSWPECC
jgi:hypothetical protein